MKQCSKCKGHFEIEEFAFRNKAKGTRHTQCTKCRKETAKRSYERHKAKTIQTTIERQKKYTEINRQWKDKLSCTCCGEDCRFCLEFHHLDPTEKEAIVSVLFSNRTLPTILKEVDKCIVVCSNCHKKIHADIIEVDQQLIDNSKTIVESATELMGL